jgi:hypothetical protein
MDITVFVFPWRLSFYCARRLLVLADEIFDIFWGFGPPYSPIVRDLIIWENPSDRNLCCGNVCHLGHVINPQLNDDDDIQKRKMDFNGKVNSLICFFHNLDSATRYKLFCSYCSSYYGSVLWLLSNEKIEELYISWRKGVRRIWNLCSTAHCSFLPLICRCLPLNDELYRRTLTFVSKCLSHSSRLIKSVTVHAMFFSLARRPY